MYNEETEGTYMLVPALFVIVTVWPQWPLEGSSWETATIISVSCRDYELASHKA